MYIELGKFNQLKVVKFVDFGLYLDGGDDGEILLPLRYVPEGVKEGDVLSVFLYLDNEERLVATTQTPLVQVGEFAFLEVNWVNQYGAFLNWGLMKDLFVPFREQKMRMVQGKSYIVYCYQDKESYRLMASAKVNKFLSNEMPPYQEGQEVDILIWQKTDLGFKAIVENKFAALLFRDHNGFTSFNDKSDAEEIYNTFGVSKKTFKKAVGELYKMRLISLQPNGISLNIED